MPWSRSSGSKPVTTIGVRYLRRDRLVFPEAHHRADVARGEEPLHLVARRAQDRLHGRRHQHVRAEDREIAQPQLLRLPDRHRVAGRRGLETDGEEHDLAVRVRLRQLDRVQRRVDHAHIAALRPHAQQVDARPGHAQHVAERGQDHLRPAGNGDRLIDQFKRGDAHRAAGAMHQRDLQRQQPVDPGLDQRVRLSAADLHDRPGPRHRPFDGRQQLAGIGFVSVLIYKTHGILPTMDDRRW